MDIFTDTVTKAQKHFKTHSRSASIVTKLIESFSGFPGSSVGKESACNTGDSSLIPGLGRSPGEGKGYPLQYSGLENSMDSVVHGVIKSWTWVSLSEWFSNPDSQLNDLKICLHFMVTNKPWEVDVDSGRVFVKWSICPSLGSQKYTCETFFDSQLPTVLHQLRIVQGSRWFWWENTSDYLWCLRKKFFFNFLSVNSNNKNLLLHWGLFKNSWPGDGHIDSHSKENS